MPKRRGQDHGGGSKGGALGSELADPDLRGGHRTDQGALDHGGPERLEQVVAEANEASSQDDGPGVEQVQEAGNRHSQMVGRFPDYADGESVPCECGLLDCARRQLAPRQEAIGSIGEASLCASDECLTAYEGDEASPVSAEAGLPVRIDGHVSDLSGCAGNAPGDLAPNHEAGSDPGGELDVGEVLESAPGTPPALGQGTQVRIVFHEDRNAEPGLQRLESAASLPGGQHDGGELHGVQVVHRRGHSHPDPLEGPRRPRHVSQARLTELFDELPGTFGVGSDRVHLLVPCQDPAPEIREGHGHVGGPHVHPQDESRIVLELEQDRTSSSSAGSAAHLGHELGLQKLVHELRGGGARDIEAPGEIGSGDPLFVPDGLEGAIRQPPAPGLWGRRRRLRWGPKRQRDSLRCGADGHRRRWTLVTYTVLGSPEMIMSIPPI
jgi:hypothetical protein